MASVDLGSSLHISQSCMWCNCSRVYVKGEEIKLCALYCPDDVRHDVYLTLCNGLFNKGTKRADKNVQVDVEVLNDKDQVMDVSRRS